MDLLEALRDVDAEIAECERQVAEMRAKVADLDVERRGLLLAAKRHGISLSAMTTPLVAADPSTAVDWVNMTRTDAVERVMVERDGPIGPAEITEQLALHGRGGDTIHYVSAALSHLRKKGRAKQWRRRGFWVHGNYQDGTTLQPVVDPGADTAEPPAPDQQEVAVEF